MGQCIRKILKTNDNIEAEPSRNAAGDAIAVVAANVEQTGDIFKLDIDCFEEAFDYLPIQDLINVGKTCKRMQQVAGYCFQQNYSGHAICDSKTTQFGIRSNIKYEEYRVEHFARFIQKIEIHNEHGFQYFFDARSKFQRLKKIHLSNLKKPEMNRLKEVSLGKIEVLRMHDCDLKCFHELIERCVKIKCLDISLRTGEFSLPNQEYPTVEHLKLFPHFGCSIECIPTFLELNPNIRKFTITSVVLWKNRDAMLTANIKLDHLAINIRYNLYIELKPFFELLNDLHEHGFYKKLHFYCFSIRSQEEINRLTNVKGLIKLQILYFYRVPISFSALKNLEELSVAFSKSVADLKTLPTNLINLKRITFGRAGIDDIMPFIRRSVEMQGITINNLGPGVHFNEHTRIIDMIALNKEREQLPGAQKITLYVKETIYLPTKWAMKGNDFEFIRLKREKPFDCYNHVEKND